MAGEVFEATPDLSCRVIESDTDGGGISPGFAGEIDEVRKNFASELWQTVQSQGLEQGPSLIGGNADGGHAKEDAL